MTTATKTRRNDHGDILITDLTDVIKEGLSYELTHVQSRWHKTITKLDKAKTNGYSLVGVFLERRNPQWIAPGTLVLDCASCGSRKNQRKCYGLGVIQEDGSFREIATAEDTTDWAVSLWDVIEEVLAADRPPHNPLTDFSDEELRDELARRSV